MIVLIHYVQDVSLIHPRGISHSCMSPCRSDYITILFI
nr:MAG TPA: hypothetical protein [Caudoviricetes sp.]